jgi:hypothetical protein
MLLVGWIRTHGLFSAMDEKASADGNLASYYV